MEAYISAWSQRGVLHLTDIYKGPTLGSKGSTQDSKICKADRDPEIQRSTLNSDELSENSQLTVDVLLPGKIETLVNEKLISEIRLNKSFQSSNLDVNSIEYLC